MRGGDVEPREETKSSVTKHRVEEGPIGSLQVAKTEIEVWKLLLLYIEEGRRNSDKCYESVVNTPYVPAPESRVANTDLTRAWPTANGKWEF